MLGIKMRPALFGLRRHFFRVNQVRKYSVKDVECPPHMNELPVPCGPWDPWYKAKQSFYNMHLAAGITWWLFSFGMAMYTNSIYLNAFPPAQPGPPSDMVEECDDSDSQ